MHDQECVRSVRAGWGTGGEAVWSVNSGLGSVLAAEVSFPQCESASAALPHVRGRLAPLIWVVGMLGMQAWCSAWCWSFELMFFFFFPKFISTLWPTVTTQVCNEIHCKFHNWVFRLHIFKHWGSSVITLEEAGRKLEFSARHLPS